MTKLTAQKVRDYMSYRATDELNHCPEAIAKVCNDMASDNYSTHFAKAPDALDYMRLLFFNDPIPQLHTHSYGFKEFLIIYDFMIKLLSSIKFDKATTSL